MELAHILEELAYDLGELPREAIEAAVAKQLQITPYLLHILEDAVKRVDEIVDDDNYQGHFYALYLLAQFREERAFPLILQLLAFPGEIPYAVVGDVLTEDMGRILASVCGKNVGPILSLIENPIINEYVRAACLSALVILVGCGTLSRDTVLLYFKSLFAGKLEKKGSFVWGSLVTCCCQLYPDELLPPIQSAFEEGLIDTHFITWQEVCAVLSESKESRLFYLFQNAELIDDTVTEMEKWLVPDLESFCHFGRVKAPGVRRL